MHFIQPLGFSGRRQWVEILIDSGESDWESSCKPINKYLFSVNIYYLYAHVLLKSHEKKHADNGKEPDACKKKNDQR